MRRSEGRAFLAAERTALCALCVLCGLGRALAGDGHRLKYEFKDGERSAYRLTIGPSKGHDDDKPLAVSTTSDHSGVQQKSSTETTLGLIMDVVEHVKTEGEQTVNTLGVSFRNLTVEQNISGPAGRITLVIDGEDVVVRSNGKAIVNTKESEGKDLAEALLREFAFLGEEGTLTVGPSGRVSKAEGPDAFRAFLGADTRTGLWALETKDEPVRVEETWTSGERKVEGFKGLDLSATPLRFQLSYTLEGVVGKMARINVRTVREHEEFKGRLAKVSSESLTNVSVKVPRIRRSLEGTIDFDIERGRVVESKVDVNLEVEIEMKVETDKVVTTTMSGSATVRTVLLKPDDPDAKPPEEPEEEEAGAEAEEGAGDGAPERADEAPAAGEGAGGGAGEVPAAGEGAGGGAGE